MIELATIDRHIDKLINYLASIQNTDGSFSTMHLQPYYYPNRGWMKWPENSPIDTAASLMPLLFLNSSKATDILKDGKLFLRSKSMDRKFWAYAALSDQHLFPYDSDSTSLCSFILSKNELPIKNKKFLNTLINKQNHYTIFINPKKFTPYLPLLTFGKIIWRNIKVRKSLSIKNDVVRITDWEFSITCNNLLYIGKTPRNKAVWDEIKKSIEHQTIDYLYFLNLFHSFYLYARLSGYGEHTDLIPEQKILDQYVAKLYAQLNDWEFSLNSVLFANALLFLGCKMEKHPELVNQCLADIEEGRFKNNAPYYSSNIKTDSQPGTMLPNTYSGAEGITCSLYIEFLNLYRKQHYGRYYGYDGKD